MTSRIFKKLRLTYLINKKVGKYLLYALGEIALVVIGILIALQVNNWNETRKEARVEDQLLDSFLRDLAQDTLVINIGIEISEHFIERRRRLLEQTSYDHIPFDELTELATRTGNAGYLTLTRAAFLKLQSYRGGYPISEPMLLDQILNYYTLEFEKHQAQVKWDDETSTDASRKLWYRSEWEVVPLGRVLGAEHAFPSVRSEEASANALRSFLRTPEARNIYRMDYFRKYVIHQHLKKKKKDVLELMNLIRAYRDGKEK